MAQSEHRFGEAITRLLDLRGQVEPGLVADYQLPVIVVNDPAFHAMHALRGESIVSGRVEVAALAGNNSFAGLHNPEGSGHIVTVESFWQHLTALTLTAGLAGPSFVASANWTVSSGSAGVKHDSRLFASAGNFGVARLQTFQQPAGLHASMVPQYPAVQAQFLVSVVLHPGYAFVFQSGALNQAVNVTLRWVEHRATSAELAVRR